MQSTLTASFPLNTPTNVINLAPSGTPNSVSIEKPTSGEPVHPLSNAYPALGITFAHFQIPFASPCMSWEGDIDGAHIQSISRLRESGSVFVLWSLQSFSPGADPGNRRPLMIAIPATPGPSRTRHQRNVLGILRNLSDFSIWTAYFRSCTAPRTSRLAYVPVRWRGALSQQARVHEIRERPTFVPQYQRKLNLG